MKCYRVLILIITFSLLISAISCLLATTTTAETGTKSNGQIIQWPMFGKDDRHSSEGNTLSHGISAPWIKWDYGQNIDSLGSTIGDFTKNTRFMDISYYKETTGVVFGDGTTVYIKNGDNGKTMWKHDFSTVPILGNITEKIVATPSLADLDNNNKLDIIAATINGKIYAVEPIITDNNGEYPLSEGGDYTELWSYSVNKSIRHSSPVLVDTNGDGTLDVVIGADETVLAINGKNGEKLWSHAITGTIVSSPAIRTANGGFKDVVITSLEIGTVSKLHILMLNATGTKVGDEKTINVETPIENPLVPTLLPSPSTGDVNGDGFPDIIILSPAELAENGKGVIHVYDGSKNTFSELWSYYVYGKFEASPAVGDLDNDGRMEIVGVSWDSTAYGSVINSYSHVYVLDDNGMSLWDVILDNSTQTDFEYGKGSPVLSDVDKDGKLDVIYTTYDGHVYALNGKNGNNLWKYRLERHKIGIVSSPAIGDLDGDGFVDVVVDGVAISEHMPDLLLTSRDITLTNTTPKLGDTIGVRAIVHNRGTRNAGIPRYQEGQTSNASDDIEVLFYDGYVIVGMCTIDYIPARDENGNDGTGSAWINFTIENTTSAVRVVVDPSNNIEELRTDNNNATKPIGVQVSHRIAITCDADTLSVDAGQQTLYILAVKNIGATLENITFDAVSKPANWIVSIDRSKVTLDAQAETTIVISIATPVNAHAGRYLTNISGTLASTSLSTYATLITNVKPIYGFVINSDVNQKNISVGGVVYYNISVQNNGNAVDTISFSLSTLSAGWNNSKLTKTLVYLEPYGTSATTLVVMAPLNATEGDSINITVTGASMSDTSKSSAITITTVVGRVDLVAIDLKLYREKDGIETKSPVASENTTIKITVGNIGNVDANNVEIVILIDNVTIKSETMDRVKAEENKTLQTILNTTFGNRTFSINVDPDSKLKNEYNRTNNTLSYTFFVRDMTATIPYILHGILQDPNGSTTKNATLKVINLRTKQNSTFSITELDNGTYTTNLLNLPGGYNEGDEIEISAYNNLGNYSWKFYAYSEDSGKSVDIRLIELANYSFKMAMIGSNEILSYPGNCTILQIRISNLGNVVNRINLSANNSSGLDIVITNEMGLLVGGITLGKGEVQNIYLNVTVEEKSYPDVKHIVLRGTSREEIENIEINITIGSVYDIVAFAPPRIEADPGNTPVINTTLRIANNGNIYENITITTATLGWEVSSSAQLAPYSITDIELLITMPSSVDIGSYAVNLTLLPENASRAQKKTIEFVIIRSDLAIVSDGIRFSTTSPEAKKTEVIINAIIKNIGTAGTSAFSVKFVDVCPDGKEEVIGTTTISPSVPANDARSTWVTWTPKVDGIHTIRAVVDYRNEIVEINEGNNVATSSIYVSATKSPDLEVTREGIAFSNDNPKEGEEITITALIKNINNGTADNVAIRIFVDGTQVSEQTFASIAANERVNVTAKWKAVKGMHAVKVEIIYKETETNLNNNVATRYITVEETETTIDGFEMPIIVFGVIGVIVLIHFRRKRV